MVTTTLDPGRIDHYRRTEYRVADAGFTFTMQIDAPCEALLECMQHYQVTDAAYLTAWNPRSEPTDTARNQAAQRALEAEVAARGWRSLFGEGVAQDGGWPAEPSILVLGISLEAARGVGRKYGQNAIVTVRSDDGAVPRLVLLV